MMTRINFGLNEFKIISIIMVTWLVLSLSQTLHFYIYFDQTLWNSIRWSFRDWFVWFIIFAGIYKYLAGYKLFSKFSLAAIVLTFLIAIGSGVLQTLAIVSLDFIAGTANRPFWQDFAHFYSKRWLQYLFIFGIFWLLVLNRIFDNSKDKAESQIGITVANSETIKINDGKENHWLKLNQITSIEAVGNYICFHTDRGQIVARGPLRHVLEQIGEVDFIKLSRSRIVAVNAISNCKRVNRNRAEITLKDGSKVSIGPTYWPSVKQRLNL